MAAGVMSAASAPLSVTADQAVVDERGYVYVVGTDATGGIAMQMVAAPALPLRTATAAAAHAASS